MSFLARLILGSSEFVVLRADYEISQPIDQQNKPNGKPRGGIISITVESSNKNDLAEWMVSPTMKKSGQITFFRRDANSSMKTLAFNDGYCIGYQESFDASSPDAMSIRLRISAGEIKINGTSAVTNPWSTVAAMAQDAAGSLGISNLFEGIGAGGAAAAAFSAAESMAGDGFAKANELKQQVEEKAAEAASAAAAAKQEAEAKAQEAKDIGETAKKEAEAKAAEATAAAEEAKNEVESKAQEAKETAEAAKNEAEAKADEAAATVEEAKNEAEAKAQEAKETAEATKDEAEAKANEATATAEEAKNEAEAKADEATATADAAKKEAEETTAAAQNEAEQKEEEIASFIP